MADYLRGVYAWTHAVLRALDVLVAGLCIMQPDWVSYRLRIEEARNFHFDELEEVIKEDLASLLVLRDTEEDAAQLLLAFSELITEARKLEVNLCERFG